MMKKLCYVGLGLLMLSGCSVVENNNLTNSGIFSWKRDTFKEKKEEIFENLNKQQIERVYQSFSSKTKISDITDFLQVAENNDIDVFQLVGDPLWGLDQEGKELINHLYLADTWNKTTSSKNKIKGIMVDVEPYLIEGWDSQKNSIMESYVESMKTAYQIAKKLDLQFIACIPYYYDTIQVENYLENLIEEGCDEIAIMNYNKNDEIGQVKKEIELAKKYKKKVTIIYELQKPGEHKLTSNNTYYNDGIEAINDSWNKLYEFYQYDKLSVSYHAYDDWKEVSERE